MYAIDELLMCKAILHIINVFYSEIKFLQDSSCLWIYFFSNLVWSLGSRVMVIFIKTFSSSMYDYLHL